MRKHFFNVAAFLLGLSVMILAQAPDGAAPAGKAPVGPDAAAANLVNTVCASCHTLDRVKNKTADKAGWTTTVARMKDKGAGLTDEQVPVVVEYLTKSAGTLTIAAAGGPGRAGGKGGGFGGAPPAAGKNLQVLTGNIPETMQSFVQALGLLDQGACAYCHVEDRSSDQKKQKVTARRMVIMMRAINGTFPDGTQHVTCFTCHRGGTTPPMTP
jgi:hypothetical protein